MIKFFINFLLIKYFNYSLIGCTFQLNSLWYTTFLVLLLGARRNNAEGFPILEHATYNWPSEKQWFSRFRLQTFKDWLFNLKRHIGCDHRDPRNENLFINLLTTKCVPLQSFDGSMFRSMITTENCAMASQPHPKSLKIQLDS